MIHIDSKTGNLEISGNGITILTELAIIKSEVIKLFPDDAQGMAEDLLKGAEKAAEFVNRKEERLS